MLAEHNLNVNIRDFLLQQQAQHPEATGALTATLEDMSRVANEISWIVRYPDTSDILGSTGNTNVQGEQVLKLDDKANCQFRSILSQNLHIAGYASEEDPTFTAFPPGKGRQYIVYKDPLDGSANFGTNVSIGSIFSIYSRLSDPNGPVTISDFLQPGCNQVASGYFLYGPSTTLAYTAGDGVHIFTLDPRGNFVLPKDYSRTVTPEHGNIYSLNEGYRSSWDEATSSFVTALQEQGYSSGYVRSMVADVHRGILKGGVFIYPGTQKNPNGKLRLNYELNPMAFLVEQAGGKAVTSSGQRILDIKPEGIHDRCTIIMGSKYEVDLYLEIKSRQPHT